MFEKRVTVNTSMPKKVVGFLESYEGEDYKFKCIDSSNTLKAVFQVTTNEDDNEKVIKKTKDVIKSTPLGSVLYFSVKME